MSCTELSWNLDTWRWRCVYVSLVRSFPRAVKAADELTAFQGVFATRVSSERHAFRVETVRNSVELIRYGHTLGCIGCEAAMTQRPIINAMSSDVALSLRVRDAHERLSHQQSDAEPEMKKVRFDYTPDTHQPLASAPAGYTRTQATLQIHLSEHGWTHKKLQEVMDIMIV